MVTVPAQICLCSRIDTDQYHAIMQNEHRGSVLAYGNAIGALFRGVLICFCYGVKGSRIACGTTILRSVLLCCIQCDRERTQTQGTARS
jgi:hypothetical protein